MDKSIFEGERALQLIDVFSHANAYERGTPQPLVCLREPV